MSALDLASYVQRRMESLGLTVKDAATRSGISRQTWYKLRVADIKEAKLSTLMAVSTTLKVSTTELLDIYFLSTERLCGTVWSDKYSFHTPPSL